jgi:hypothetical protein
MPQVLRHVVETQRGVRRDVREKAGLTLYDVFFTETSRVNQVRVLVVPPPLPPRPLD